MGGIKNKSKSKKILCVIDSLNSGGAQRQLVNLAVGFKQRGHDVSFLVYHKLDFYRDLLKENDIPIHYIVDFSYIRRLFKMRRFIRSGKYDSVLSFLEASNFICEFAGFPHRNWRLVVGERSANPNISNSLRLRAYRWFHFFTDYVVSNSYMNIDMIKNINPLLSNEKYKVIYNMVDIHTRYSKIRNDERNRTYITIAASYRELKNLDGLIDGVRLLPNYYRDRLQIDWYGNKTLRGKTSMTFIKGQQKIEEYGLGNIIHLHDAIDHIIEIYKKSDFIALLSHYEGFPNSICEAMACGKPVIASSVSDIPLIIMEGENGFLCEPNDIRSIAESLKNAIDADSKKRTEIGQNNIRKADLLFNKDFVVDEYLQILV